jgi:hypothetical protein
MFHGMPHKEETKADNTELKRTGNVYYKNNVGLSMIDKVVVKADNQIICEYSGETLDLHNQLHISNDKKNCMKEMYGSYETKTSLVLNGKTSKKLFINIPLFANKTCRQFFPLIALGSTQLTFTVVLNKLSDLVNVEGTENHIFTYIGDTGCVILKVGEGDKVNTLGKLNVQMMVQSFMLSPLEHSLFLHNTNTFMYKRMYTDIFELKQKQQKFSLSFMHPTEWLAFCYRPSTNERFEYERVESLKMTFNGVDVHRDKMNPDFFRLLQKHSYFENNMNDNIYVYSFCLKAGHGQNSGSINFSKITEKEVEITLSLSNTKTYSGKLFVFASSYNFLECDGKKGKLLYL